uniref:Uncharacterized protein n=1 Tax=Mycena chlorophos TaxID=658473 RepID=A0ABQ0M8I5_MYCCL|nr:predicted protein [Mycena chlorophos]
MRRIQKPGLVEEGIAGTDEERALQVAFGPELYQSQNAIQVLGPQGRFQNLKVFSVLVSLRPISFGERAAVANRNVHEDDHLTLLFFTVVGDPCIHERLARGLVNQQAPANIS